ncbi:beta-ribofuranosylaminobenzene 5'-phosphate synthase [Methanocella conradii]|uniref:beta-ribofuranosylaminobenzene 5'-phosphate synthase n=1 Tax=Methanocella conradii TaxID=1175444 RepID=UPI00157D767B|nr:beta-ribofuranosylaminobenzene 5'-phosphate synthase [Methanocella conradii]
MLRIRTPSRIHITLIDLNGESGRVDGGIGITLDEPCIEITAEKSDKVIVKGDPELRERMRNACEAVCPGKGVEIAIKKSYWNHIGLGSGTQAALAAGTAASRLYGLDMSPRDIAIKAGRGGTSGIGIGAFEKGGFLLDGGHKMSVKKAFLPSSFSKGVQPAPLLLSYDFPGWDIVLAIPPYKGAYDLYEKDIFSRECPIPLHEVQEVCHIILMQILPAIVEKDLEAFGKAINAIQDTGFKRREIGLQPVARELIREMREAGAAGAGMSSFGPTVYAITDRPDKIASAIRSSHPECTVIKTRARNSGAEVTYE